jgi:hypothetical protein
MDWRCGSSSTVPALQVGSPEFKPSPTKKKGRKEQKKRGREQEIHVNCELMSRQLGSMERAGQDQPGNGSSGFLPASHLIHFA